MATLANHIQIFYVGKKFPLNIAAGNGNLEICQLFLDSAEEKNPRGIDGWTPLHFAAKNGHLEVCQLIFENGTDKNPRGNR